MSETYVIDRINDLLRVPIERRRDCLRELEYALGLHELAFGEEATSIDVGAMRWTDDGDRTCTMHSSDGKPMLTLEVKDKADK